MDKDLLQKLLEETKKEMAGNKRFHSFGHAMEVFNNAKKLINILGGDETVILTAALLHDLSNRDDEKDGPELARALIYKINYFPKNKIDEVIRLIKSIEGRAVLKDELILNEADRMAVFSKLSLVRAMMMYGKKGLSIEEAKVDFLNFIEKKHKGFKLIEAKKLIYKDWRWIREFVAGLY